MSVYIKVDTSKVRAGLLNALSSIGRDARSSVVEKVAYWTFGELVKNTPKGFTGETRNAWSVENEGEGFKVVNSSNIMTFLEHGTRDHGPTSSRFLFVPLNGKGRGQGSGLKFGQDYVLSKMVRGIKAMNIAKNQASRTESKLSADLQSFVSSKLQ